MDIQSFLQLIYAANNYNPTTYDNFNKDENGNDDNDVIFVPNAKGGIYDMDTVICIDDEEETVENLLALFFN